MTSDVEGARELARLLLADPREPSAIRLIQGIVTNIEEPSGTVELTVSGDATFPISGIKYLDSYKPVLGDTVWCMKIAGDVWVIGDMRQPKNVTQGAWNNLTFSNGWTSYGSGNEPGRYWKDPEGFVYVQATLKGGTMGNVQIASLPVGFRPWRTHHFWGLVGTGARIDITPSGQINLVRWEAGGANTYLAFSVRFQSADVYDVTDPKLIQMPWVNDWSPINAYDLFPVIHVRDDGFCQFVGGGVAGGTVGRTIGILPESARTIWGECFGSAGWSGSAYQTNRVDISRGTLQGQIGNGEVVLAPVWWYSAKAEPRWIAPTLGNGWMNYDGLFAPAGYMLDDYGVVHLRGLIRAGTMSATIFTLPTGYRPNNTMEFPAVSFNTGNTGRIDVTLTGNVIANGGSNGYIDLGQVMFRAEW